MNENVLGSKAIKIKLGDGKDYVVAPLPLDDLIEVWPIIEKLEKAKEAVSLELIKDIKKLAYVVLKVNNDIEEDQVGKIVDLLDMQEIIPVIVGQKKTPSIQKDKPGQI